MDILNRLDSLSRDVELGDAEHTVILSLELDATVVDAWSAITNPDHLGQWFEAPSGELVEGGHYQLASMNTSGAINQCRTGHSFRIEWNYGDATSTLAVGIDGDATAVITLRHTVSADDHWQKYGPAATGIGWEGALLGLAEFVANPSQFNASEVQAVAATAEGVQLISSSAEAWEAAHVAAGGEPELATAMANNAAAFYRGEA